MYNINSLFFPALLDHRMLISVGSNLILNCWEFVAKNGQDLEDRQGEARTTSCSLRTNFTIPSQEEQKYLSIVSSMGYIQQPSLSLYCSFTGNYTFKWSRNLHQQASRTRERKSQTYICFISLTTDTTMYT